MKLEFESNISTVSSVGTNPTADANSANRTADVSQMLQAGIKAAQEGNRTEARSLLLQVTEIEPENENAWLWMASISEYPEELLIFLNNILAINPNNSRALEWSKATKAMLAKNFVQRGIDAAGEANMELAKQCFLQAIVHDSQNEMAWLWMASISDSVEEKISHLQKVLNINPNNETAHASRQAAKNQIAESLLQKANRAAISGEREAANTMLQEVLRQAPELEEAWILKSYLSESFSEKITAFEKVLSLNPDNDAANSGLASLRAMLAKTESQKAEQMAMVADLMKAAADNNASQNDDSFSESETAQFDEEIDIPTQKLECPPDLVESINNHFNNEQFDESPQPDEYQSDKYQADEQPAQNFSEFSEQEQIISLKLKFEPSQIGEQTLCSVEAAQENEIPVESVEQSAEFSAPAEEISDDAENNSAKPLAEPFACPFCKTENESNTFVCSSCRTILTFSDLEMLLAHSEADGEILYEAVTRMEAETATREFDAHELKTLALGHINLKNLRHGILHLQAALRINPNDVMLGSQVNSLKIRLLEIEQQESIHSAMTRGRKIMVVDDSATVRKLISSKLEKVGHEVLCAVDGIDALEQIKEFVPDLILLDIMMPQLDGYQVCKMIRSNEATRNVPIVMISGKDGFFDKVRGRMSGTTGYITKPFGPETLMKTVESYII